MRVLKTIYLLFILSLLISCDNYVTVDGIQISNHLCEIAEERYGVEYAVLLEKSLANDKNSIREYASLSFDGAYGYEHGEIVVKLINRVGSEKFISAIDNIDEAGRNFLITSIQVGLEYGKTTEYERYTAKTVLQFLGKHK